MPQCPTVPLNKDQMPVAFCCDCGPLIVHKRGDIMDCAGGCKRFVCMYHFKTCEDRHEEFDCADLFWCRWCLSVHLDEESDDY